MVREKGIGPRRTQEQVRQFKMKGMIEQSYLIRLSVLAVSLFRFSYCDSFSSLQCPLHSVLLFREFGNPLPLEARRLSLHKKIFALYFEKQEDFGLHLFCRLGSSVMPDAFW